MMPRLIYEGKKIPLEQNSCVTQIIGIQFEMVAMINNKIPLSSIPLSKLMIF